MARGRARLFLYFVIASIQDRKDHESAQNHGEQRERADRWGAKHGISPLGLLWVRQWKL